MTTVNIAAAVHAARHAQGGPDAVSPASIGAAAGVTAQAVKTSGYSANVNELVPADATSAPFTVTLPSAPAGGSRVTVKKIDASTNAVTLARGGSDVFNKAGGSTSLTLSLTNQAMTVQYQATGGIWYVVNDDFALSQIDARYDATGSATAAQAAAVAASAQRSSNLSDLANAATARTNLGLGTAATQPSTAFDPAGAAAGLSLVFGA